MTTHRLSGAVLNERIYDVLASSSSEGYTAQRMLASISGTSLDDVARMLSRGYRAGVYTYTLIDMPGKRRGARCYTIKQPAIERSIALERIHKQYRVPAKKTTSASASISIAITLDSGTTYRFQSLSEARELRDRLVEVLA